METETIRAGDDDEIDPAPFLDYLRSKQGHELASRIVTVIEDLKKAAIQTARENDRFSKWQQTIIVGLVVVAVTTLSWIDKFDPAIGILFGTLIGYLFGKRTH